MPATMQLRPVQLSTLHSEAEFQIIVPAIMKGHPIFPISPPLQQAQIRIRPEDPEGRPKKGRRGRQFPWCPGGNPKRPFHQSRLKERLTASGEEVQTNPVGRLYPGRASAIEPEIRLLYPPVEENPNRSSGASGLQGPLRHIRGRA